MLYSCKPGCCSNFVGPGRLLGIAEERRRRASHTALMPIRDRNFPGSHLLPLRSFALLVITRLTDSKLEPALQALQRADLVAAVIYNYQPCQSTSAYSFVPDFIMS